MAKTCKQLGLEVIKLDAKQLSMAKNLLKELDAVGIKNTVIQNAILTVCYKEGGFRAVVEDCYGTTPLWRIRQVFGYRVAKYDNDDAGLRALSKKCTEFFDQVYGAQWDKAFGFKTGNTNKGDGFKYRGRGLNGITFKVQYINLGKKMGLDLLNNPELLEKPEIQAKASAVYFAEVFKNYDALIKRKFGASAKDIKDYDTALKLIYNCNAGLGYDINKLIANDTTDGWAITQCAKKQIPVLVRGAGGSGAGSLPIIPLLAGAFLFFLINPKWIKNNTPRSLKKFLK
jgi:predicted chitinase